MRSTFVRSSGAGPSVLCLHSSGASSRQWDAFARRIGDRYRVIAPDLAGHGRCEPWAAGEIPTLRGEVAPLAGLIAAEAGGVHLVGHSYGGAVALKLALAMPDRVRSVTVYEPVLFNLLLQDAARDPAYDEVVTVGRAIKDAMYAGRNEEAATRFVDYWSGPGAFRATDTAARASIVARMIPVMQNFDALFSDTMTQADFGRLKAPVLLLHGTESPQPARAVTHWLANALPHAWRHEFAGQGHMAPVTDSDSVDLAILAFLDGVTQQPLAA